MYHEVVLHFHPRNRRPRGAAAVLFIFFMVIFCGLVAISVDVGYMMLVRTELQAAVDSAALAAAGVVDQSQDDAVAEAIRYARMHRVGGQPLELSPDDITIGAWDPDRHEFRASKNSNSILIRPQIERSLFFAGIFGNFKFRTNTQGSAMIDAIATSQPRDIAFVVDLSGWGNAETELAQTSQSKISSIEEMNEQLADLYEDFGIDPAEVRTEFLGEPLGAKKKDPIFQLAKIDGLLAGPEISERYRVASDDSEETRIRKAYLWIIENQIVAVMPKAIPNPAEVANYDYWVEYIDYLLEDDALPAPPTPLVARGRWGKIPPGHLKRLQRIKGFQNDKKVAGKLQNQLFYPSYFQFMLDAGRDSNIAGRYPALSTLSGEAPAIRESTAAGEFLFAPRTQPLHSIRRSLIAAVHTIRGANTSTAGRSMGDRISIITFDRARGRDPNTPALAMSLTDDYDAVMDACTQLEASADDAETTSTDAGLRAAWSHLLPEEEGGHGRSNAKKIVILITIGTPDTSESSPGQIENYLAAHDDKGFYGDGDYPHDAAMMYAHKMRQREWQVIPVGIGPNADYKFVERMAKMTGAFGGKKPPKFDKSPEKFEQLLVDMLSQQLVKSPKLVQ